MHVKTKLIYSATLSATCLLAACGGGSSKDSSPTKPAALSSASGTVTTTLNSDQSKMVFTPSSDGLQIAVRVRKDHMTAYTFTKTINGHMEAGPAITALYDEIDKKVLYVGYAYDRSDMENVKYLECAPCNNTTLTRGTSWQDPVSLKLNGQILLPPESENNSATARVITPRDGISIGLPQQYTVNGTLNGWSKKIPANADNLVKAWSGHLTIDNQIQKPIFGLWTPYYAEYHVALVPSYLFALTDEGVYLRNIKTAQTTLCNEYTQCKGVTLNDKRLQIDLNNANFFNPDTGEIVHQNLNGRIVREAEDFKSANIATEPSVIGEYRQRSTWIGLFNDEIIYHSAGQRTSEPVEYTQASKETMHWYVATKNNIVIRASLSLVDFSKSTPDNRIEQTYACDNKTSNKCTGITVKSSTAEVFIRNQKLLKTYPSPVDYHTYVSPEQAITVQDVTIDHAGY